MASRERSGLRLCFECDSDFTGCDDIVCCWCGAPIEGIGEQSWQVQITSPFGAGVEVGGKGLDSLKEQVDRIHKHLKKYE